VAAATAIEVLMLLTISIIQYLPNGAAFFYYFPLNADKSKNQIECLEHKSSLLADILILILNGNASYTGFAASAILHKSAPILF
jgi:hypothetical protein